MALHITVDDGGPQHVADRSDWQCSTCQQPWPCPAAKVHLGEEYAADRITLGELMCAYMFDALAAPLTCTPLELYTRFIAWTRYPRAADAERVA